MARLGVGYDLLTHESDILALDFFHDAFAKLEGRGRGAARGRGQERRLLGDAARRLAEFAGLEDPDKVIVRSDGTVTYVGKDIAYQLWKFGLLGKDFGYRFWHEVGTLARRPPKAARDHPAFGARPSAVINVIDARQSYLQKIVRAGLAALGHPRRRSARCTSPTRW